MAAEVLPSVEIPAPIKTETEELQPPTPPDSVHTEKHEEHVTAHEEDDIGEISPDHYYNDGQIPVFKPTMKQFESFPKFIRKIDKYGMESGIVKVIPPLEWRNALPALDEQVKTIKVKNPIMQEFHGAHGIYTQANMEKQRSYNLPQWKSLTSESNHQPPAKRGERRRNQEKVTRATTAPRTPRTATPAKPIDGQKRGRGRPRKNPLPLAETEEEIAMAEKVPEDSPLELPRAPPTPASPAPTPEKARKPAEKSSKSKGGAAKSVSSRRTHNSAAQVDEVDEEAFRGFDYRLDNPEEWTKERCEELEPQYWKSLNFNNPMYGADMPGSLFDDGTTSWNVAKLESLLDVLGQKIPGVNTAYLYLGMWKATFAWHLEDVDLYSINYIHFGAPKQWYSISQRDARKFERAMKSIWTQDAKNCDQFLRHKTYLVSPQILKSQYGVEVNKLVHYEGEFVITFPYGYHSGYNLGYNCAESVNFATEAWLEYGKIARKCNCEDDSVWVDVFDIERKLRGEPTPEYYEEYEDDEDEIGDLPTPPSSEKDQVKPGRKRKLDGGAAKDKVKRLRITMAPPKAPVCALCPNEPPFEPLLPTEDGKEAHRTCALYIPETYVTGTEGNEVIAGIKGIDRKRRELKCLACRNKNGAVFQCSQKKCARAYHPTCAAIGGVSVEIGMTSFYGEDGTEYQDVGIDFRCRFHRAKRPKYPDEATLHDALEKNVELFKYAASLQKGDLIQYQFISGEIRCGYVLENSESEACVTIQSMPFRTTREVSYNFLLFLEKSHQQLKPPSPNALPLPAHLAHRQGTSQDDPTTDAPKTDEPFNGPSTAHTWAEFRSFALPRNSDQVQVLLEKPGSLWYYLGRPSTDAKAYYTHDPAIRVHNPASMFLKTGQPGNALGRSASRKSATPSLKIKPRPQAAPMVPNPLYPQPIAIAAMVPKHRAPQAVMVGKRPSSASVWPHSAIVDPEALRNQQAFMASSTAQVRQMADARFRSGELPAHHRARAHTMPGQEATKTGQIASPLMPENAFAFDSPGMSVNTPPSMLALQKEASESHKIWGRLAGYAHYSDWMENRPLVYKSPYGPPGVVNEDYLPFPSAPKPSSAGLAESYFLSRSSTEQQLLRPHVRSVSTEKAQLQVQEAERRRLFSDSRPGSASDTSYFPIYGSSLATTHPQTDLFAEASAKLNSLSNPTPNVLQNRSTPQNAYSKAGCNWADGYQDPALQFSHYSPAGCPHSSLHGDASVPNSSGLSNKAAAPLSISTDPSTPPTKFSYGHETLQASTDGTSGSPLRVGRDGAGGETLPVMQDYSY